MVADPCGRSESFKIRVGYEIVLRVRQRVESAVSRDFSVPKSNRTNGHFAISERIVAISNSVSFPMIQNDLRDVYSGSALLLQQGVAWGTRCGQLGLEAGLRSSISDSRAPVLRAEGFHGPWEIGLPVSSNLIHL